MTARSLPGIDPVRHRTAIEVAPTTEASQSVFGRLARYEDVNDAGRLGHDPAIRWIVDGKVARAVQLF